MVFAATGEVADIGARAMTVLNWVLGKGAIGPARDRDESRYVFAVQLTANDYPPWARLVPPREALRHLQAEGCIILARCDTLFRHLAHTPEPVPDFPNRRKLEEVLELIARQRTISMPIVEPAPFGSPISALRFKSGRHRVVMLHELGAAAVPVVVPRSGVTDLLGLIS